MHFIRMVSRCAHIDVVNFYAWSALDMAHFCGKWDDSYIVAIKVYLEVYQNRTLLLWCQIKSASFGWIEWFEVRIDAGIESKIIGN